MKFSDTSERSKGKLKAENIFFDNKELQETFQQVNRLCCQICSSSVSLINLLDDKYQYTISKCGKWRISKLTRKQSVCNFVVQEGRLLVINDLKDDKRTRNLQFPEDHQIRFYAGIPIRNNSGEILATLCLICYYPKELSEEEQQNFLLLAKHLEVLIDAFENQLQNERNTQVSVEKYIKDKEVWLLEIHHRIKNNLADICGMLQVERSESDDPIIKKILSRTESRIIAALKLHELLYEAHDMVHVNLKEYIEALVERINSVTKNDDTLINFNLDVGEISLDFSQTFPLALIINELVTNSLQHAFKGKSGSISIGIQEEEGAIKVRVGDDGEGISGEKYDEHHFGFRLVNLLAKQLQAEFKLDGKEGTKYELSFHPQTNSSTAYSPYDVWQNQNPKKSPAYT